MKLTVGTWNIWIHGTRDPTKIAEVIQQEGIDIIGLQEVIVHKEKSFAEEIARELGYHVTFFPISKRSWGNALLSRFPLEKTKSILLNPPGIVDKGGVETEPRILVSAHVLVGENEISFSTTHLHAPMNGFLKNDLRMAQIQNIGSIVEKFDLPVILVGDFNALPESEEIKTLEQRLRRVNGDGPTWTTHPWDALGWKTDKLSYTPDHIFVSEGIQFEKVSVINNSLSDHLPIKAVLSI